MEYHTVLVQKYLLYITQVLSINLPTAVVVAFPQLCLCTV